MENHRSSGWVTVGSPLPKKANKSKNQNKEKTGRKPSEVKVKDFLSTYKTVKCTIEEFHDTRLCPQYHDEDDKRRNPFIDFYLPDDVMNQVERMYHPINFRTSICRRGILLCPFEKNCSFAHSDEELRCLQTSMIEYEGTPVIRRDLPSIGRAVSMQLSQKHSSRSSGPMKGYNSQFSQVAASFFYTEEVLPLAPGTIPWFMVHYEPFFAHLEEKALEDGLSQVTRPGRVAKHGNQFGVVIRGPSSDLLLAKFTSLILDPPKRFFVIDDCAYQKRVLAKLTNLVSGPEGQATLLGQLSSSAYLEIGEQGIRVCAKNGRGFKGQETVKLVFEKIGFWVEQSGYKTFLECIVCGDPRNKDEGIVCRNGHFFCSSTDGEADPSCIWNMVNVQIQSIFAQNECVTCAVCKEPIELQTLATHLAPKEWKQVNSAVLDAKVKHTEETLSKQFDQRLQARIQELMEKYESSDARVKMQAEIIAQQARNEALNLKCPHCNTVYCEFDGCMALKCGSCDKTFCGYCHRPCTTSQGAHEHVRECDQNETINRSYYATAEEIKRAQRKYRTRQLKTFLRKHKKEIQNATVIELQQDLADLDIEPGALFEFGNLMPEP